MPIDRYLTSTGGRTSTAVHIASIVSEIVNDRLRNWVTRDVMAKILGRIVRLSMDSYIQT